MGILSRISKVLESNLNALIEKAEDPAKLLDQAIEDMKKGKNEAREAIIEAKSQKRLNEARRDKALVEAVDFEKKAMAALMSIEGFRTLNQDIETIINKSEAVKKARKEANDEELSAKKKKDLSEEEREYKSLRKQIQEKLIKFATRVPIFMYLTDYRERTLKDVITQLEPGLFKKVTGLTVKDFELLVSLGVFNSALMNDAIYKFKRYEDASLSYTGINKHEGEDIGLYDTVITRKDAKKVFENVPA